MNKTVAAFVAIALVLAAGLFVTYSSDDAPEPERRLAVPAVPNVGRITIDRPVPRAETGRQKLVFERTDDRWRITSPIEGGVSPQVSKKLSSMFEKPIVFDDIELSGDALAEYGLDEENVTRVELAAPNEEPIELTMGLGFVVEETGAKRTYMVGPRNTVLRARSDMGIVFAQPLALIRDKSIFNLQPDELTSVAIRHSEDEVYRFVRDGEGGWELTSEPRFDVEQPLLKSMERGLTNFRVRGFLSGSAADAGLDEPTTTVTLGTRDGDKVLHILVEKPPGERNPRYVATLESTDEVFLLQYGLGAILTADESRLRSRLTREIGRGKIDRVELAGEAGVVIERKDDTWMQVAPQRGEVSPKELGKFLGNLELLTVIRYSDTTPEEAGLTPDAAPGRVGVRDVAGERYVLLLGKRTPEDDGHLAKWEDLDDVFVLPNYLYERFHPGPDDILIEQE